MNPNFEIRLINVNWSSKLKVRSIKKALAPFDIEFDTTTGFVVQAFAYPKIDNKTKAQIAIKCFDNNIIPRIILQDSTTQDLLLIEDPASKEKWWIELGKWEKYYLDAPTHRHSGKLKVQIGDQICTLNISIPNLSDSEYEEILNDFKNGCWELILDPRSGITVEKYSGKGVFSETFFDYLGDFIKSTNDILRTPNNELRENQILERQERVKPIPRTFMELAVKGNPRRLSSRGYFESYNTPENRYIAALVYKISILLYHQLRISEGITKRIRLKITEIEKRIDSYSDQFMVDPKKLEFLINREKKKIEAKNKSLNNIIVESNFVFNKVKESVTIKFKITSEPEYSGYKTTFYAQIYQINDFDYETPLKNYLLEFSQDFTRSKALKNFDTCLMECCKPIQQKFTSRRGNEINKREIDIIKSLCIVDSNEHQRIKKFESHYQALDNSNWETELSDSEKAVQEKEKKSLEKQIEYLNSELKRWENVSVISNQFVKRIKLLSSLMNRLQIKALNRFPQSIVFIQNPKYAKTKATFEKMMLASTIKEDTFNSLLSIDEYGVIDIPQVYEKWCLIKIVELLKNIYGFEGDGWKDSLLKSVSYKRSKPIVFKFISTKLSLGIVLTYQPILPNNRTPDYRLDLFLTNEEDGSNSYQNRLASLIMDAKFKYYDSQAELLDELKLLIDYKDYGEKDVFSSRLRNLVYILHPSEKKITEPTTTQTWSSSSYYGGDSLIFDELDQPDHKFGAILLRPYQENDLQRLLIMFFQYAAEEKTKFAVLDVQNPEINFDPFPRTLTKLFCPICGSSIKSTPNIIGRGGRGKEYKIECINKECAVEYIINYCNNCGNRLWKLGRYWTYHDTSPLSPYDIKCPNCGASNPMNIDVRR
jgi:hypothetical protein